MTRRKSNRATTKAPIAIVDTCVIILLLGDIDDPLEGHRVRKAKDAFLRLVNKGVHLVLPAPVVAEVGPEIAATLIPELTDTHVEPFDLPAAAATWKMLSARPPNPEQRTKSVVKYDAMIAGIAESLNARYLITANGRDFRGLLGRINSRVQVVDTDRESIHEQGVLALSVEPSAASPVRLPAGEREA